MTKGICSDDSCVANATRSSCREFRGLRPTAKFGLSLSRRRKIAAGVVGCDSRNTKMNFLAVTIVIIASLSTVSRGQNENIRGILRTTTGVLVVWNEPGNNFTLEARGTNIENIPNQNVAFLLDRQFLQVVTASVNDILADSKRQQKLDDNEILIAHQAWETKYLKDDTGVKPKISSEFVKLSNGKTALLWSYRMSEKPDAERPVFLTVVKGDHVLELNGKITPTVTQAAARSFLLDTIQTLKTSPAPLSQADAQRLAGKAN